jgi:type II secretory pathway component GspD/PulD (secretin)
VTSQESTTTTTTVQYQNIGRILTIIPQVNSLGLVNLQIKAEVSDPGPPVQLGPASTSTTAGVSSSSTTNTFPSFTTRDVETTAVVQDGETLVLGGIIDESKGRSLSGIPYLMDIPVFGWFFRSTTETVNRTDLIILITPHVIRNLDESRRVTEQFKEKLSNVTKEIERMKKLRDGIEPPPQKPSSVAPNKQSRVPELAPENSAAGAPRGSGSNEKPGAAPISANVEAPPSPGTWRNMLKFFSFGLY